MQIEFFWFSVACTAFAALFICVIVRDVRRKQLSAGILLMGILVNALVLYMYFLFIFDFLRPG